MVTIQFDIVYIALCMNKAKLIRKIVCEQRTAVTTRPDVTTQVVIVHLHVLKVTLRRKLILWSSFIGSTLCHWYLDFHMLGKLFVCCSL